MLQSPIFWRDLLERKSHSLATCIKISNIPTGFIIKEISAVVFSHSHFFFQWIPSSFPFLFSVWKCCIFFMRPFWPIPTKSEGWSEYIWLCYNLLLVGPLQNERRTPYLYPQRCKTVQEKQPKHKEEVRGFDMVCFAFSVILHALLTLLFIPSASAVSSSTSHVT